MPRKQLPVRQRHRDDCTRPRDCACPWSFRVRLPDGTMPRVTRDGYDDAVQAYHELMSRKPEPLADRTTTVAQWAERWLASGPSRRWARGTAAGRRGDVRKHILPVLGHYLVTELRRDDVRLWAAGLPGRGAGPAAMVNAAKTLSTMYSDWLKDDRILPRGNPVPAGLVKKPARKEFAPLTAAQVEAVAAAMPADMALMVRAEAFYGARASEICGLREEDVTFTGLDVTAPLAPQLARLAELPGDTYDARKPRLRFQRKLERDRTAGPIKNARGNRAVPLPQWLAAALAAQLEKWPPVDGWLFANRRIKASSGLVRLDDVAAAAGVSGATASVVISGSRKHHQYGAATARRVRAAADNLGYVLRHQPYGPDRYIMTFIGAAEDAGVTLPPRQATHALRHHCVSVLRGKGWSDQDIGYWIGDTAMTVAEVYGRPMPDALDRISAELSAGRAAGRPLRAVE
jgi:integrase